MKRNSTTYNFTEPSRQSYVAILMIIWKTYRIIFRQAWPFLLIFLFGGGSNGGWKTQMIIAIVIFSSLGMILSIINYFRYYFYIDQDELIIESGVLKRTKLNVPFERIQTINFEQNIVHRMLNVVRLKIDTAGSSKAEFQFQAIDIQKADALRELLLSKKKKAIAKNPETILEHEEAIDDKVVYKPIMTLGIVDLIKAGMVENHLKSGGFILAFMWWIWQSLDDIEMSGKVEETVEQQIAGGLMILGILVLVFLILSFLVSLVRMVIVYYDLQFLRSKNGFKIHSGLFTKKDTSALDHKIQMISWGDNPLKKLIGIKDLTLKQASSVAVSRKTAIKIPSCSQENLDLVRDSLYGKDSFDNMDFYKVDKRYFTRIAIYLSLLFISLAGLLFYAGATNQGIVATLVYAFLLLTYYLSFKKKRYGYNDEMIIIRGGAYGDKTEILPIYKIQSLSKTQTPYQSRNGLANLVIHTAAGKVAIPYILIEKAQQIMDEFLYRIEVDRRRWI